MKEAMKLALEVKESMKGVLESVNALVAENKALKEALAEQHLQALHDENVRLGLYEQEQGEPVEWATKEQLLQDWLPRLWDAWNNVRDNENASAQETLYELYVEMKQQTIAEKIDTMSEITLEDQLSVMASDLLAAQKRIGELDLIICQRHFMAQTEQGEPVAEIVSDAFGCLSTRWTDEWTPNEGDKLYTTPPQRTWVGLSVFEINDLVSDTERGLYDLVERVEANCKEKNNG